MRLWARLVGEINQARQIWTVLPIVLHRFNMKTSNLACSKWAVWVHGTVS